MKTAVSIPDEVFQRADQVANHLGWSRSQLYARAVAEFVDRQGEDPVTKALDALADDMPTGSAHIAARRLIESGAWEW